MKITSDWHIHTKHSCDAACLEMQDLLEEARDIGIEHVGVTDHLHTPFNAPDIAASRNEFDKLKALPENQHIQFHFGIEVSCVSQWELGVVEEGKVEKPTYGIRRGGPANGELAIGIDDEFIDRFGIEFVVAGTHWPMYQPYERELIIRDYHRQNMFLAEHPLVDIVAHPWWWMGHWADQDGIYRTEPWFDDFCVISESMHQEFAAAVLEHNKKVEVNLCAILLSRFYPDQFVQQYLCYLRNLKSAGVKLTIGSDCHFPHYTQVDFAKAEALLTEFGFENADFWVLSQ